MSSEIGVRLTGDNSEFRSMLNDSAQKGGEFAEHIADHVGKKLFGLRDVSHAVASALGLNLEKIAEHIAAWYTGIDEEEKEAYKKAEQLSAAAADAAIKNMRASLTEEQRYQLALKERDSLLNTITNTEVKSGKDLVQLNENKLKLEERISEIRTFEAKQAAENKKRFDEEAAARFAENAAEEKAMLDRLPLAEKEHALREKIATLQTMINVGHLGENDLKRISVQLSQANLELLQTTNKEQDVSRALLEKKGKLNFDALSTEEKIATYVTSIETLEKLITQAKKDHVAHDEEDVALLENKADLAKLITQREREASGEVAAQKVVLQAQTEIQDILSKGVGALSEQDKTRLKDLAGENSILKEQISVVNDLTRQFENFKVSVTRTGNSYEQQSTSSLQGVSDRLNDQLNAVGTGGQLIKNATINGNYGDWLTANTLRGEIKNVENELNLRAQVQAYDRQYGDAATIRQFGDSITQRALRDLQTTGVQTSQTLLQISNQISKVFPVSTPPPPPLIR